MSKIIIHAEDGISDPEAMRRVLSVVDEGMVSEHAGQRQYCFVTTWRSGFAVYAHRLKSGTHVFRVTRTSELGATQ